MYFSQSESINSNVISLTAMEPSADEIREFMREIRIEKSMARAAWMVEAEQSSGVVLKLINPIDLAAQ